MKKNFWALGALALTLSTGFLPAPSSATTPTKEEKAQAFAEGMRHQRNRGIDMEAIRQGFLDKNAANGAPQPQGKK